MEKPNKQEVLDAVQVLARYCNHTMCFDCEFKGDVTGGQISCTITQTKPYNLMNTKSKVEEIEDGE